MTKDNKVNSFKICLVGDSDTGKTNLLSRLISNIFELKCEPTSGVDNKTHNMLLDNNIVMADIWDVAGREKYRTLANSLLHDAAGVLLVYDISNEATFKNIAGWLKDVIQFADSKTVVKLVGNKSDLQDRRAVPSEKAKRFADDHGLSFIETSFCDASNVKEIFQSIVTEIGAAMNSVSVNSDDYHFSTCSFISKRMKKLLSGDLSCNDTQQQEQQQLFHVVLIDLKKAALHQKIHCVEKPLKDDLKYVALSYRWGELQETVIDTKVGYKAAVTSFDLKDFYQLCYWITQEIDLMAMEYVWVGAICVDQTNYKRQKATIHQMSTIYEQATYILAVPDLHVTYLRRTSTFHTETTKCSHRYRDDIYHLIHGNADQLVRIEERWFNKWSVPMDTGLRHLLNTSTDHCTNGLLEYCKRDPNYNSQQCLDHIYETSQAATHSIATRGETSIHGTSGMHHCNQVNCPLDLVRVKQLPERNDQLDNRQWKQMISERSTHIRRSINFMADLIKDWSSRVWVISEYNIAKDKNNMKYWFTQLALRFEYDNIDCGDENFSFFKFDFKDPSFSAAIQNAMPTERDYNHDVTWNDPVYLTFHKTMLSQLNQQTLLEMMLKSKASKNEDRFYAIFPLTEYKNAIGNKTLVESWKIDTFVSVRLKLFEIMNTKDKLNFLFFSGNPGALLKFDIALPTFATSSINWECRQEHFMLNDSFNKSAYNFDLTSNSAITLCQSNSNDKNSPLLYLNLKPKEYFVNDWHTQQKGFRLGNPFVEKLRTLSSDLQSQVLNDTYALVGISNITQTGMRKLGIYSASSQNPIYLVGNFEKNIWILCLHFNFDFDFQDWTHHTNDDHSAGFNIY